MSNPLQQVSSFGKGIGFGLLLATAFVAGAAFTSGEQPGVVQGTEFRLVDKNGQERAKWAMEGDAVELFMTDRKGRARLAIRVDDAPVIKFWGEQGQNAIILTQEEARGTWLELCDQGGSARIDLKATKAEAGGRLYDAEGAARIYATCDAEGAVQLNLADEDGKVMWVQENKPKSKPKPQPDPTK